MGQLTIPSGEINELTHYPVQIDFELFDYQKEFLRRCEIGNVIEPTVFYGEQKIWNPKPEKCQEISLCSEKQ
jgi:hypothetical protein